MSDIGSKAKAEPDPLNDKLHEAVKHEFARYQFTAMAARAATELAIKELETVMHHRMMQALESLRTEAIVTVSLESEDFADVWLKYFIAIHAGIKKIGESSTDEVTQYFRELSKKDEEKK